MGLSRREAAALGLLSAGALSFEVALLRLYAVQQFYHFAFLVISLAVLGGAAGGTALALRRRAVEPARLAAGFAAAVLLTYATLNFVPFDSYAIAWDRRQLAVLVLYFASAAFPFFFHGWFTGAALAAAGGSPGRAYAANLIGAAAGPPLALLVTVALRLEAVVALAAATGLASAALLAHRRVGRWLAAVVALGLILIALRPPEALLIRLSPNKALTQARLYPHAVTTVRRDGPSVRLDVVESEGIHTFPGLSLNHHGELPPQAGVYLDGDGPFGLTALDPDSDTAADLARAMPDGLAYALRPSARALVLHPGTGLEIALALAAGASHVSAPVDEPLLLGLLRGAYAEATSHLADDPRLTWLPATSRAALESPGAYDVVEFALTDPFRPAASGAFSLTESYDLTAEAMIAGWRRLSRDGVLIVTRWLTTPPAESLRLWSTVLAAMRRAGVTDLAARVIAYRSLRTSTILVSPRPWTAEELVVVRGFLDRNGFDAIYLPDLRPDESNRFNRIPGDPYPSLFRGLMETPRALQSSYAFRVDPPSDDRPFFFHFFRWRQTPAVLAAFGRAWQPFGGSGYLVLLALLVLMIVLAAGLCLAPALARRTRGHLTASAGVYFASLAAGFMFVELALIQQMTLPLERPSLAFAAVLSILLLSSGIGSRWSDRVRSGRVLLLLGVSVLVVASLLPLVTHLTLTWPYGLRLVMAALMLAPLGFLMGVPFPAGLRWLTGGGGASVGWAWSINGAVSGVAGVVGAMIAIDLGLRLLMVLGGLAYLAAWLVVGRPRPLPSA
jgi:hypothetical protein